MDRSVPGRRTGSGLKASLAELYAGLQRAAVRGVVPPHVFRSATEELGLSEAERLRLADELGRLNLRVGEPVRSAETDFQARGKVVLSRVDIAGLLLKRFADAEGRVTNRALEGIVRLAGLAGPEACDLRAAVPTLPSSGGSAEVPGEGEQHAEAAPEDPRRVAPVASGDVAEAVAAALAMLAEDRFVRRPENRILTAAQEVGLGVLLRGGAGRAGEGPTDEELAALGTTDVRRRARDCLVVHNQRLVHSLARQFQDQGLDYDDLFQHGVLGLMRAARKFDPLMGNKFSTYATWWIRQSIARALADEGTLIRIPVHMHELAQKVARTERALLSQRRSLSAADVAVACDLSVEKVEKIREISRRTDSLDRVIGDGTHLGELIETRTAIPGVERTVLAALDKARVMDVVRLLPERYAHIVTRRFGLDNSDPATLEEIGKDLKITRERVRQLETHVLPLLRLAYQGPADDPYTAMRLMLNDVWHGPAPANPVRAITKDLTDKEWNNGVGALCEFRKRNRRSLPDGDHKEGTFPLGRWVVAQRRAGGPGGDSLPTHRRIVLESLGMVWERKPDVARPSRDRRRLVRAVRVPRTRPQPGTAHPPAPSPGTHGCPAAARPVPEADRISEVLTHPHYTAHWEKAVRLGVPFSRSVRWMAEYTLLSLGPRMLFVVLGAREAAAVTQAARSRRLLDRPAVLALESLTRVLDALRDAGLRPEEFFEATSPALRGNSPRNYLAQCPLTKPAARSALSDALHVFLGETERSTVPAPREPASAAAVPPAAESTVAAGTQDDASDLRLW